MIRVQRQPKPARWRKPPDMGVYSALEAVGRSWHRQTLLLQTGEWNFAEIYRSACRLGGPRQALNNLKVLCEEATLAYLEASEQGTQRARAVRSALRLRLWTAYQLAESIVRAEAARLGRNESTPVKLQRGLLHYAYRLYRRGASTSRLQKARKMMEAVPLYKELLGQELPPPFAA